MTDVALQSKLAPARSQMVTVCSAVPLGIVNRVFWAVYPGRRNDAPELAFGGAGVPLADSRKTVERIPTPEVQIQRRVEDQFVPDEATRVVARRIVIVGSQMVGGLIG